MVNAVDFNLRKLAAKVTEKPDELKFRKFDLEMADIRRREKARLNSKSQIEIPEEERFYAYLDRHMIKIPLPQLPQVQQNNQIAFQLQHRSPSLPIQPQKSTIQTIQEQIDKVTDAKGSAFFLRNFSQINRH